MVIGRMGKGSRAHQNIYLSQGVLMGTGCRSLPILLAISTVLLGLAVDGTISPHSSACGVFSEFSDFEGEPDQKWPGLGRPSDRSGAGSRCSDQPQNDDKWIGRPR